MPTMSAGPRPTPGAADLRRQFSKSQAEKAAYFPQGQPKKRNGWLRNITLAANRKPQTAGR
jgi:hypothetical protein